MKNNKGYEMKILNYLPNGKIDVIFPASGYIARSRSYHSFKKGLIKDKLSPSLRGIGIIGEESSVDEFGNKTEEYDKWSSMINRTYCDKVDGEWISIDGSYVSEEFRYFSKFKEWYNKNKYEIPGERMVISKMVVEKGNKEYSSEKCAIVPLSIEEIFRNTKGTGKFPIGVVKRTNKYSYCFKKNGKLKEHCGFSTEEEAFLAYKNEKESYIKSIANKYKGVIPDKVYNFMMAYEVEID